MQRQPSRDTGPELAIRRLLHGMGLRYRTHVKFRFELHAFENSRPGSGMMLCRRCPHPLGHPIHHERRRSWTREVDVVFPRAKVCLFVDGCFWHRCPECYVGTRIARCNGDWWEAKLQRNVDRDEATDRLLTAHGWTVVRVWEHEDPSDAAPRVAELVRAKMPAAA